MKSAPLKNEVFEDLSKLVKIIDDLRDEGLQDHIKLPRIAVLGTQSSGKSSLLESIVGLDFLPRGEGVVTRRPLELRLKHILNDGENSAWAIFEKNPNEKFTDFEKVRQKINEYTDADAGKGKNIIPTPIVLNIYSHSCPDLTIIDLPGITRIPLSNSDQPKNIEEITKNMARMYVEDSRTIILCVVPGNNDISVSDALQMARELDPDGYRTIGVITKIDILDKGTDAVSKILGNDVQLRLGYVGIVGRSQKDINDKLGVQKGLQNEDSFFAKTAPYCDMPDRETKLGTKALKKKLTEEMYKHIAECLPQIDIEIDQKIKEIDEKLNEFAESPPEEEEDKTKYIWKLLSDFLDSFKNSIKGKFEENSDVEFSFGSKIKKEFSKLYLDLINDYKASKIHTDKDIINLINKYQGNSLPGFPRIDLFLDLLYPELSKLLEPAIDCLERVFELLFDLAKGIVEKKCRSFPAFCNSLVEFVHGELYNEKHEAKKIIKQIMEAEMGYLYTCDENYKNINLEITKIIKENKKAIQGIDPNFIEHLKSKIDIYYTLIVKTLRDSIPKAIGFFLIKESQEKFKFSLFNEFLKNKEVMNLLSEPSEIVTEKKNLRKTLRILRSSQDVLKRDNEITQIRNYLGLLPRRSIGKSSAVENRVAHQLHATAHQEVKSKPVEFKQEVKENLFEKKIEPQNKNFFDRKKEEISVEPQNKTFFDRKKDEISQSKPVNQNKIFDKKIEEETKYDKNIINQPRVSPNNEKNHNQNNFSNPQIIEKKEEALKPAYDKNIINQPRVSPNNEKNYNQNNLMNPKQSNPLSNPQIIEKKEEAIKPAEEAKAAGAGGFSIRKQQNLGAYNPNRAEQKPVSIQPQPQPEVKKIPNASPQPQDKKKEPSKDNSLFGLFGKK